ncbi:hypothetical protein JIN85_09690 [Luteolibacter pohnpeiensis]|uniref:Uncharacterized protein n=1 Tax=Luteolibacter pohnpeiensis TaxID=454153 RepID=A0A934S7L1_9BACT|nr:hypothetical protein [Luteolibacter pohnpeiensis]MBK1882689.1 hypothetical protein [Luteolibacter pohnpeiensis]
MKRATLAYLTLVVSLIAVVALNIRRQGQADEKLSFLHSKAEALGIGSSSVLASKVDRDRKVTTRSSTPLGKFDQETIQFIKEKSAARNGGPAVANLQDRQNRITDIIQSLNDSQFHQYILNVLDCQELDDKERMSHCELAFNLAMKLDGKDGLLRYMQFPDLVEKGVVQGAVCYSIISWARSDLEGAISFTKDFMSRYPDLISDSSLRSKPYFAIENAKTSIIKQVAETDRSRAMQLMTELDIKYPDDCIFDILKASVKAGDSLAALQDVREFINSSDSSSDTADVYESALNYFGGQCQKMGFDAGVAWIKEAQLTQSETYQLCRNFGGSMQTEDAAKWIDWFNTNLPEKSSASIAKNIIFNWTNSDYKAVGNWLNTLPASKEKYLKVSKYAYTISDYEPEDAVDWLESIPEDQRQNEAKCRIYNNLLEKNPNDPSKAEDFAVRNHIPIQ